MSVFMSTARMKTIGKEAITINGVDLKMVFYFVGIAIVSLLFFQSEIEATEQKLTQSIEAVAKDNRDAVKSLAVTNQLAQEQITVSFKLFTLKQEQRALLSIKDRGDIENGLLADVTSDIARLEARQRELDRLELERRASN